MSLKNNPCKAKNVIIFDENKLNVNDKAYVKADRHFFIIPDNYKKTLTVSPTKKNCRTICLNKKTAKLLIKIIAHHIQKW